MTAYILECRPKNAAGTEVLKTFGVGLPDEAYLNQAQPYPLRLNQDFAVDTQVYSANLPGDSTVSIGTITLTNVDGRLDDLLDLSWGGAELVLKSGPDYGGYGTFTTYFTGAVQEIGGDTNALTIILRDASWRLMKAMQPNKYAGSGGKEGGRDLVGLPKPLCIGPAKNMAPVIVDVPLLTYQLHDGSMQSITGVWDDAVPLTYQRDYSTYALLVAAKIPPGYYCTCVAEGFIRLGAPPAGTITADGVGQYGLYTDLASLLYQALVGRFGIPAAYLDKASFDQLTLDAPKPIGGLYYQSPEIELSEFLQTAVSTADAYWAVDNLGRLFVRQFKFTASTLTLTEDYMTDLRRQVSSKPLWRARAEYDRNLTVLGPEQVTFPTRNLVGVLAPQEILSDFAQPFIGDFDTYIGTQKLNDLALVDYQKVDVADWLELRPDGTYVVTNPPAGTTAVTLRASVDEFRVDRTLRVSRASGTFYLNYGLTGKPYLHYGSDGKPVTAGQEVEIVAVGAAVTAISAVDSRNVSVPLIARNGNWYVSIDNVSYVGTLTEVTVTATSSLGSSRISVPVFTGKAGTGSALAEAGKTAEWPKISDPDGTKPEDGATKGLGDELLFGRTPQQIVNDLDLNADSLARQLVVAANLENLVNFNATILNEDNQQVGVATYVKDSVVELKEENRGIVQTLSLLGTAVGDGVTTARAWQMDLNTVQVRKVDKDGKELAGYESLSSRLSTTAATMGSSSGRIDRLDEIIFKPDGSGTARSVLELDLNGYISGMYNTNNGKTSDTTFIADTFRIISGDSTGQKFQPFLISGNKVKMTDVEVDTIKVGTGYSTGLPTIVGATAAIYGGGSSNFKVISEATVALEGPGTIHATSAIKQDFTDGPKSWIFRLLINGTVVFTTRGGATIDSVAIQGSLFLYERGTYTVQVQFAGENSSVIVRDRNLFSIAYYGLV